MINNALATAYLELKQYLAKKNPINRLMHTNSKTILLKMF